MDVVATRLHVCRYSNRTISKESVQALLQAAMAAHSEGDERPWHFVVVENLSMRGRIVETYPTAHIVVQGSCHPCLRRPNASKAPRILGPDSPPQPRIS